MHLDSFSFYVVRPVLDFIGARLCQLFLSSVSLYTGTVMVAMEFVGLALGRLICAVSRTQVVAKSVISVACLIFATVAGFMPSFGQIPTVLRWMSWFSPPAYGFEGVVINEYEGRTLSIATISTGDLDVSLGTLSGEEWMSIMGLPRVAWTKSYTSIKVFDLFMLLILSMAIDILGFVLTERNRKISSSQLRRPMRESKSLSFAPDKGEEKSLNQSDWPTSLTISDISYHVPLKRESAPKRCSIDSIVGPFLLGEKKGKSESVKTIENTELQLLDQISATFKAGRAIAMMGTSGAGKVRNLVQSQILDCLACLTY